MLYLKWNKRLFKNRVRRTQLEKAVIEKEKEYKKVILKEEGLQDLEPEAEIKFDDKGFEEEDTSRSNSDES